MAELMCMSRAFLRPGGIVRRMYRMLGTVCELKFSEDSFDENLAPSNVPDIYKRVLDIFPRDIEMSFAYGSGVFQQAGDKDFENKMMDFIFVVDDPLSWHEENMAMNMSHYSWTAMYSKLLMKKVQNYGAGVYFNTDVPFENRKIKYGIIGTDRLISDLNDWNTLYISGRLHKPIKFIKFPENPLLIQALETNIKAAFHAAVVTMPESFSEFDFFNKIASLSYSGDVRMALAEDANKVQNIVSMNVPRFRKLYQKYLMSDHHLVWHREQRVIEQYLSHASQKHHFSLLPRTVYEIIKKNKGRKDVDEDLEDLIHRVSHDSRCPDFVDEALSEIVANSSRGQSLKGLYSAGPLTSTMYLKRKMMKRFAKKS